MSTFGALVVCDKKNIKTHFNFRKDFRYCQNLQEHKGRMDHKDRSSQDHKDR